MKLPKTSKTRGGGGIFSGRDLRGIRARAIARCDGEMEE